MIFEKHPELQGKHAYLGASKFSWLNYDDEKLAKNYQSSYATDIGTAVHELAAELIQKRIRINKKDKNLITLRLMEAGIPQPFINSDYILNNLVPYVTDAIHFKMVPEVVLKYTDNAFGTTDAIQYYENKKLLRIHDLKTGVTPAHMEQLQIYEALFFIVYGKQIGIKPKDIDCELRIYQGGEIITLNPDPKDTEDIIQKIIHNDKVIEDVKGGYFRV